MALTDLPDPEQNWARSRPTDDDLRNDLSLRAAGMPADAELELLSGGQANRCVRVRQGSTERVLRRYLRDPSVSGLECALLQLPWRRFRVPGVLSSGPGYLWLEFVPHSPAPERYEVGFAAGRALVEIHGMVFPEAGFLAPDLSVRTPLGEVWQAFRDYIGERNIDPRLKALILAHWDRHREAITLAARDIVLLHGDFKAANLGWTLQGELLVLDWEFAYAGPALLDLGQLLRWNPSMDFVEGVLAAYGLRAPVDLALAETFDLVNLASLLHDCAPEGRRHRDVTERIRQTLGLGPGLRTADAADRAWINACYDEIGFLPSGPSDLLVVATWLGHRVGMGRIVPVAPGMGELGGMYVASELRGRHIASRIVRELMERTDKDTLFCIPFTRLVPLYLAAGFRLVRDDEPVPGAVARKLDWCETAYTEPVSLLVWSISVRTVMSV